jgi:hypothetical protein
LAAFFIRNEKKNLRNFSMSATDDDETTEERNRPHSVAFSLPRPQRHLPEKPGEAGRFGSLDAFINQAWEKESPRPTHAWMRYSLSVGIPLEKFGKEFKELLNIRHAFGRRVLIAPASIDHHEIEVEDFDYMANPDTGQQEIEVKWRKKRCDGGSHMMFAVESTAEEYNRENSAGLETIEALEALVRITLGAMLVISSRRTIHMNLSSGKIKDLPQTHIAYGAKELPRSDAESIDSAISLAAASAQLPADIAGRLSLGLRWANLAFNTHDLLAFWTAIEIIAGGRGIKIYPELAKAYGMPSSKGQELAKALGVDSIYKLRGDLTHDGRKVWMGPEGASFLNALVHDLARHLAGLPSKELAKKLLSGHRIDEWFQRTP